ncbi:phosphoenolpyruvate synthase [Streptomyces sp. XM83C]|uniref:rifamycin-inactivating phosphotransferase n=1 Tax=Streptomyces sp. XM83C TaxID=2929781 RepID=UPI001FF72B2A|nr:rifamycin-inactivating phosphotransferase [Streptomyces sp. XM83C]MCK1819398.1 phosphoenolpyruvate synthase [Streptomyces sp. XM83C]
MTESYVRDLREVDASRIADVGGKGAQLGALTRIDGIRVPDGFCVTTDAYRRAVTRTPAVRDLLEELAHTGPDDREGLRVLGARVRRAVEDTPVPDEVAEAVDGALARFADGTAFAVRSSATAEDLPTASFAGQQDTYLNVVGADEVLRHIRRCWASLFSDRAVTYRLRNGIDHRAVHMGVVVQRMVLPRAAGVLFTADPVSGHRRTAAVEAAYGLGEALVSGLVGPDVFTVRDGRVVGRTVGAKQRAVRALPGGGTQEVPVEAGHRDRPALSDAEVLELERLGRRIEAHFGSPQDIEWCLTDDGSRTDVWIVQSRPITNLFPVPDAGDDEKHIYLSVGHQQMMTDAMKPLGLSVWQLTSMAPMLVAGGRLFVDATARLASPSGRAALLDMVGRSDPLTKDALETVLERDDVLPAAASGAAPSGAAPAPPSGAAPAPPSGRGSAPAPIETDPGLVKELISRCEASREQLARDLRTKSGPELFGFLLEAFAEHRRVLGDPLSIQVIMAGMEATWWLNDHLQEWLGEKNAADTLTLSAPGNITSEMGLALLDVADVVRPRPQVVEFLRTVDGDDDGFLGKLAELPGGREVRDAVEAYLDRYGMRCVGEIDITRPRWREHPAALVPALLDNVRNFGPGAARQRFEEGRRRAYEKERDVLARLRALPDGAAKADETKRMIDRVRTFIGYREYPKYDVVSRYFLYKQALMAEADRLVAAGVLAGREDAFHLTFEELHEVARTHRVDEGLLRRRKEEFRFHRTLTPPRVLTSDGEALDGSYRRDDVPEGALAGLPVSAGTVEGRARVVHDIADAELEAGDILVTTFTDPSWSPLFVGVAGLVAEVGGAMTHGAVIAREYGLPAVVGVPDATRVIVDGARIRVHGTEGWVEILG